MGRTADPGEVREICKGTPADGPRLRGVPPRLQAKSGELRRIDGEAEGKPLHTAGCSRSLSGETAGLGESSSAPAASTTKAVHTKSAIIR